MTDDQKTLDDVVLDDNQTDAPDDTGQDSVSGSNPATTSDDDVGEAVEQVIGNKPVPGEPFSLADEIEKDELDRRGITQEDMRDD